MNGRISKLFRKHSGGNDAVEMHGRALDMTGAKVINGVRVPLYRNIVNGNAYHQYKIMKKSYKGLSLSTRTRIIKGLEME